MLNNPATRKWLYGISFAITLLLGAYGVLDEQLISAWNFLAAAVFGVATLNTDTDKPSGRRAKEDTP